MLEMKKIAILCLGTTIAGSVAEANMVEQLFYNVAGQVTNATGARLGDEIYYGSKGHQSSGKARHRARHKTRHKKIHKKRVSTYKTVAPAPVLTDEKKIQQSLASLGFYRGKIDGEINSFETRTAIKEMNIAYGISNDAYLKPEIKDTLIYLGTLFDFDRALIASGNDAKTKAKKIQTALKIHGFYHDKIDGMIGSGTRACISNYKRQNGMPPNGALNFEEEYKLINTAKELNDKNLESSIASLKALGRNHVAQPVQQIQSQTVATSPATVQTTATPNVATAASMPKVQQQVQQTPATSVLPSTSTPQQPAKPVQAQTAITTPAPVQKPQALDMAKAVDMQKVQQR